jgi:hypothetical protein
VDDDAIRSLVKRLGRPHPSGGTVMERAAILAAGADFDAIMEWILAHGGEAEAMAPKPARSGLYGARFHDSDASDARTPSRFVLPADALR